MTVTALKNEVICFAGDSGDGIQLSGSQFSLNISEHNEVITQPDYPAEIRAPAGTLDGVSAFQMQFSANAVHTVGDKFSVLVALNAAALHSKIGELTQGGMILADTDGFQRKNLTLATYESDPLTDGSLSEYRVIADDYTRLTTLALSEIDIPSKARKRSKNFFVLGIVLWVHGRSISATERWIEAQFIEKPDMLLANKTALQAGFNYAETSEIFSDCLCDSYGNSRGESNSEHFHVISSPVGEGLYRTISGNEALSLGFVCAADKLQRPLFLGSYPITPASEILHTLAKYAHLGVKVFQAEDEIAAACAALGAAYAGSLGITSTSGPGLCLKSETLNLAVMTELPLVVINVQRGGPSTGLPTKTEQSDLLFALYGRNGDSPMPVLAAASSADCFDMALEASRIATQFMTPVILLSDGYLANGAESWQVPELDDIQFPIINQTDSINQAELLQQEIALHQDIRLDMETDLQQDVHSHQDNKVTHFKPYLRDPDTGSRRWVSPGECHHMHRIGGLEKRAVTGETCHDGDNHQQMTDQRAAKIAGISHFIPQQTLLGSHDDDVLVLSWGSTYGAVLSAATQLREQGVSVAHAHLRYLNPFPANLGELVASFKHILVMELNNEQLVKMIRAEFVVPASSFTQVTGTQFKVNDVMNAIGQFIEEVA